MTRTTEERFADALGLYVGHGKRFSKQALADASGVPVSTIERAMRRDEQGGTPCLDKVLRLVAVLPPAFTNHILEPTGKGGVKDLDCEPVDGWHINASLARALHMLAEQLEDGQHDHREQREFKRMAAQIIADLTAYIAGVED